MLAQVYALYEEGRSVDLIADFASYDMAVDYAEWLASRTSEGSAVMAFQRGWNGDWFPGKAERK